MFEAERVRDHYKPDLVQFTGNRGSISLKDAPGREVETVPLDTVLQSLSNSAARLVRAAHAGGHMWTALVRHDVPAGLLQWGHQVPDVQIRLPLAVQAEWDGDCAWDWYQGRLVRRISYQVGYRRALERLRAQVEATG